MLQHTVSDLIWTRTGAFTGFQGKEEFIQRKLSVVIIVYVSCGEVRGSLFRSLLAGKEGWVIGCCATGLVKLLGYGISYVRGAVNDSPVYF